MPRRTENPDGMYPAIQIPLKEWSKADYERFNAQRDGLDDFDAEIRAILAHAYRAAADETNDQGIRDNADLLKTMISHELPRRLGTGKELSLVLAIGRLYERLYAVVQYEPDVRAGRKERRAKAKTAAVKRKRAEERYQQINDYIAARLRKRGVKRQPTLTGIRTNAQKTFGVSKKVVLAAQKWESEK